MKTSFGILLAGLFITQVGFAQTDYVNGNLTQLNRNGGWSWYEDERAILTGPKLLMSSIANASGADGRNGVVDVVSFDLNNRQKTQFGLATIVADDHNTAALSTRTDGRYLAVYANHNSDNLTRYRISTNPGDATAWSAEQTFNNGVGTTYSNTFYLPAEGKTYNFTRTNGFDPNFLVSTDQGSTWTYGGQLLRDPAGSSSARPYVKYASNNTDKVYFISTENHPRNNNNSLFAGYYSNNNVYRLDGTLVAPAGTNVASAPVVTNFAPVIAANSTLNGEVRTHFWTTDLALDASGKPYAVFTSRINSDSLDHRFYYGRWNGSTWQVNELAKAGGYLYAAENDYTGLVALDPNNPNVVYISTKINPTTSATTAKYEIYRGETTTQGTSWTWNPITQNSTVDNIRPIVPRASDANQALLWMRGTYTTFTNYDTAIVGLITNTNQASQLMRYVDATTSNTAPVSGQTTWLTGPASGQGAADGFWHRRTGFGNGNEIFTADENTAENTPLLVTTKTGLGSGLFDIYAYFWTNPNEDWQLVAGLSATDLITFDKQSAQHPVSTDFFGSVVVDSATSNVLLYKAYLGRKTLNSGDTLQVFIDDAAGIGTSRVWYDGIGYSEVVVVVPEPSVNYLLLLIVTLLLIAGLAKKRTAKQLEPVTLM
jgi:hypothetical protein